VISIAFSLWEKIHSPEDDDGDILSSEQPIAVQGRVDKIESETVLCDMTNEPRETADQYWDRSVDHFIGSFDPSTITQFLLGPKRESISQLM
jgi:hypothetical protein